jgi:UDP-glucose 4-epimerase
MDLPVLAFRFFNVFGPLQPADHVYAAVIPRFIAAALAGQPLTIYGDGKQSRDFTYVDTVCATLTRAVVERIVSPGPVNLAFGRPRTLLDVVAELADALDTPLTVEHVEARTGDIRHSDADSSRLYELFPGTEPVAFRAGLEATIDWFRSR